MADRKPCAYVFARKDLPAERRRYPHYRWCCFPGSASLSGTHVTYFGMQTCHRLPGYGHNLNRARASTPAHLPGRIGDRHRARPHASCTAYRSQWHTHLPEEHPPPRALPPSHHSPTGKPPRASSYPTPHWDTAAPNAPAAGTGNTPAHPPDPLLLPRPLLPRTLPPSPTQTPALLPGPHYPRHPLPRHP